MESENPVWLGEYVWEETPLDGGPVKAGPLPAEVLSMFRPQQCLLCGIKTANMQTSYTHYESKGHFKKVIHHMREKYNALGSMKSNKEKFVMVKCDICDVELTSRIVYLQHYDGKQHLKNMKKRGFKPPAPEEVPPGENFPNPKALEPDGGATQDLSPPTPLTKPGDYVCALCNVTTATRGQMQVHNNGSRHMKNVAKLADGELREFYMTNGNCEPMGSDEADGAAKDSNVSDQPSGQMHPPVPPQPPKEMPPPDQPQGGYNGGYGPPGPPMDPSMMQPYPQMPYGPYPQYPMPYDYNSWGQSNMYPGYNNSGPSPYNGQYGPGPYGPGPQQYPPYGYPPGPPPEFYNQQQQFNPGQQQFNPGQQQFNPGQQQFNPGQQQYNPGQQQYNQGPQQYNQGSQQYNQGPQQYNPEQQQHYDYHNNGNSHEQNQSNFPGRDQRPNPSPKDPRRHSRNREPAKEPQVNETPLPDGIQLKPLAVLPFFNQISTDSSDDHPPGVDGPPGIDKPEEPYSSPRTEYPSFSDTSVVVDEDKNLISSDQDEPKVEPKSPPRTLLDLVRENNKKSKRSKEDNESAKVSDAPVSEASADLPPIPGLDFTPIESKPPIITWTEGNQEGEEPEPKEESVVENDAIPLGGVVPPPPHPLNPPIHFLPPSPESELPASSEDTSTKPNPSFSEPQESSVSAAPSYSQPQVSSPDVNPTPSYSQPKVSSVNCEPSQSQASPGNLQPHYSRPPVPSANPVSAYSQPPMANPQQAYPETYTQATVNPQPAYPQVPNYNAPYISTPPVSYSQAPATNYASMYPQIPAENPQPYQQVPSAPQTLSPQPVPQPVQSVQPTLPSVPPLPTELEKASAMPSPTSTHSVTHQATDKKTLDTTKEEDAKLNANKPKINSFFRRAAEKMFKEAKEKKLKEEAKKIEMDSPKDPEPLKKPKEAGKDAIVIVPPSSGSKSGETITDISAAANPPKARAHETVPETDNDVGSEPGEIVDKKPKTEVIVEKIELVGQTSTEAETPKSEKSKFDFGSKKSSESRRKRSFRVRRSSVSRSRSRSRSPKRRGRRRSRSWSPSPEKSPVGYYQRNTFQSYYGNDTSYWRNDKVQYRSYEDWDESRNDRYARRRNDRDEFGRERKWKEEKKKEERKKKKRKSRKRSASGSPPPPKASKERKDHEAKKKPPSPSPPPVAKPERPKVPETKISADPKPVTASLMQRLKGVLPTALEKPSELFPKKDVPAKLVEEVKNTVEVRDVLIRPDVDSDEAREVEKEEQEILKKVALIKKQLMEKEEEKPVKSKKRKKEKSKRRKKRSKSSSSSESDSSSSDSDSSSSSSSTASSSSSSTSAGSAPKSKQIVESLLAKLSRQAATGDAAPFDLSMLPALVKKSKKSDGSKKKKKKDKKRKKKKKKDKKNAPEPPLQVLSAFITPDGAYHCKCCNLTTPSGSSFLEHLISEKHKLLCKLISTAK